MAMYAIKDTTLTALGDAVRSKTEKYTSIADIGDSEPFYSITLDMSQVNWKGSGNDLNYQYDLDFVTLLGDKQSYTSRFYYKFEYETNNEKTFSIYIRDSRSNDTMFMSAYMNPSTEGYMAYTKGYTYRLQLNARQSSLDAGDTLTFTLRLWPCDANNMFIGLNKYTPLEMADTINGLMTIPNEVFNISGDCYYKCAYNNNNWLIDSYGDKITTNDITRISAMFQTSNGLENIPFDINISSKCIDFGNCFSSCNNLKTIPYIIGPERAQPTNSYNETLSINYLFGNCHNLREIPNDYFWKIIPNKDFWDKSAEITTRDAGNVFQYCYSLRELPDISMLKGIWTSAYSCVYYNLAQNCANLNQIVDLPVSGTYTSNAFSGTISSCSRLKDFTFETNEDGTAKTASWKSQTIDLSSYIGYCGSPYYIINFNSGITADKEVKDDATYQALKNDPDWWTQKLDYCRYNHDSAVNTINSLPDCSATGTNTIKFKGAAGALTDGRAINTLTEAEIAVAAAKGWSVAFV